MGQRAPSATQIAVAVAFAFSCFGLLLFLWNAFGGPVPFAPQGYRVKVPVNEAAQLAAESDVRISNVSVGRVKAIELEDDGENRDLAIATLEIENRYAPIPNDTRAILRQKTLLGETYVELTQGLGRVRHRPRGRHAPEGPGLGRGAARRDRARVRRAHPRPPSRPGCSRRRSRSRAAASDLSAAIANLEPFAESANDLLRVLDTQDVAVSKFVKNTGVVFGALSERQGQLRGLIENSNTVFATTAERNQDLRETFQALPTFLDESRLTLRRLDEFSTNANPVITQLRPVGERAQRHPEAGRTGRTRPEGFLRRVPQARQALEGGAAGAPGGPEHRPAAAADAAQPVPPPGDPDLHGRRAL